MGQSQFGTTAMRKSETMPVSKRTRGPEFSCWLAELKSRIRQSQIKAAIKVNTELLCLYWDLGRDIVERSMDAAYGSRFFETLSRELRAEFPDMEGFSATNLKYCKAFYRFYSRVESGLLQPAEKKSAPIRAGRERIRHQAGGEFKNTPIFQIPWRHHVEIFTQCKTVPEALFYIRKTIENGWSRSVLMNFIEADLFTGQGSAPNNFSRLLPDPQSELAAQTLKDPYNFDFLTLSEDYREKELEDALTTHVTRFLLELGKGFAFLGRQVHVSTGQTDLFIDLLFYHLGLRCYIVIELKAAKFEPEHLGKLGAYISAVNHQMRAAADNPTIGLLICKTKDNVLARYSLEGSSLPIGISEYKLSRLMPAEFKAVLPSIKEIETRLESEPVPSGGIGKKRAHKAHRKN